MGLKKKPFAKRVKPERIATEVHGNLRMALYLYMEDHETTAAESLRDGIRAVARKQLVEIKQGRKPI